MKTSLVPFFNHLISCDIDIIAYKFPHSSMQDLKSSWTLNISLKHAISVLLYRFKPESSEYPLI